MKKLLATAACIVLAATACGGSPKTAPSSAPTGPPAATITIDNFTFESPPSVPPGATVAVKNADPAEHSVTADKDKLFDVEVQEGQTVLFTAPDQPGTYTYFCSYHPMMHGTLVVK
jgi:plastocyanin